MRNEMREEENAISFAQVIKAVGGLFGLLIIMVGLFCAIRVFGMIAEALRSPDEFGVQFEKWVEAVGGSQMDLVLGENTLHLARFVALGVVGVGTLILSGISFALIRTGAQVITTSVGDKDAVKQILAHALGKEVEVKQPPGKTSSTAQYPVA